MNHDPIRRNRRLVYGAVLVAVVLLVLLGRGRILPKAFAQRPVTGQVPYTAILEQTRVYEDGTRKVANRETYAVRSDGASVRQIGSPAHRTPPDTFRTITLPDGVVAEVRDGLEIKSTKQVSNIPPRRDPNIQCQFPDRAEQFVGEERVAGHRAYKLIQRDGYYLESWYAADYGCPLIQVRMEWGDGTVNEKKLLALIPGEPDAALFLVPNSYQETPPSVYVHAGSAAHELDQTERAYMEKLDEAYQKNRPAAAPVLKTAQPHH